MAALPSASLVIERDLINSKTGDELWSDVLCGKSFCIIEQIVLNKVSSKIT